MDWAVKAAILAWYLGAELQVLNSQCKTWFEIHGKEAEAARPDLTPDLIQFLEQAQIPYGQEGESCLNFFTGSRVYLIRDTCLDSRKRYGGTARRKTTTTGKRV
jgi:hypothetical protein